MDGHHLHLLSNHFPIILLITGFVVLTFGLLKHQKVVKQVGLLILLASSITSIPAYISGEEAEHKVEEFSGVSHSIIEEHEEAAEFAFIATNVIGVLALLSLLLMYKEHSLSVWCNRIVWLLSLTSIFILYNVGETGGQIRRPELMRLESSDSTKDENH